MKVGALCIKKEGVHFDTPSFLYESLKESGIRVGSQKEVISRLKAYDPFWRSTHLVKRRLFRAALGSVGGDMGVFHRGLSALPPPALRPASLRRFLQALVSVSLGIGMRKVNLRKLDSA